MSWRAYFKSRKLQRLRFTPHMYILWNKDYGRWSTPNSFGRISSSRLIFKEWSNPFAIYIDCLVIYVPQLWWNNDKNEYVIINNEQPCKFTWTLYFYKVLNRRVPATFRFDSIVGKLLQSVCLRWRRTLLSTWPSWAQFARHSSWILTASEYAYELRIWKLEFWHIFLLNIYKCSCFIPSSRSRK